MATETRTSDAELTAEELRLVDAWWRAANYLSVGQIGAEGLDGAHGLRQAGQGDAARPAACAAQQAGGGQAMQAAAELLDRDLGAEPIAEPTLKSSRCNSLTRLFISGDRVIDRAKPNCEISSSMVP